MALFNNFYIFIRAADKQLDFRILFKDIDRTGYRGKLAVLCRAYPQVDAAAIHCGSAFQVSVIKWEDKGGVTGVGCSFGSIDDYFR